MWGPKAWDSISAIKDSLDRGGGGLVFAPEYHVLASLCVYLLQLSLLSVVI